MVPGMITYSDKPGDAFNRNDPVKIMDLSIGGRTYFTTVTKQDHQWLFTYQGIFNLAHPDVKAYRGIDHGSRNEDSRALNPDARTFLIPNA